jgi:hypothetical protein
MNLITPQKRLQLPFGSWSAAPALAPDGSRMKNLLLKKWYQAYVLAQYGGGDQGYSEAADVVTQLVDGTDTNELWSAYQQAVALRNRERQPLVDFLSFFVTDPVEGIATADSEARFERASEYGVPRSYRPSGEFAYMGYDFHWYDLGSRFTWEFLVDANQSQVDAIATQALEADNILVFQMIMWTLFNNVNRSALINKKPYNVYTFWNGADSQVPPTYRTNVFDATHNHYMVSGAATVSPGNFPTTTGDLDDMEDQLTHHGYKQSNGYRLVLMVNKQEGDVIRTFRSVTNGGTSKWDFIPSQGTPAFLVPRDFVLPAGQTAPPSSLGGMEVIGAYGEWTILQEDYIPPGYMVGFATGGQESVQNPVGIRQHSNTALRGLRLIRGRDNDYPLTEAYYGRGFGTGVRHRGAGVIMQVKASGSYVIPTEYDEEP